MNLIIKKILPKSIHRAIFDDTLYPPSFKYPAACCRKENFGGFRFDTPQLAAGSFIKYVKIRPLQV